VTFKTIYTGLIGLLNGLDTIHFSASESSDLMTLYKLVLNLTFNYSHSDSTIRDKNGSRWTICHPSSNSVTSQTPNKCTSRKQHCSKHWNLMSSAPANLSLQRLSSWPCS